MYVGSERRDHARVLLAEPVEQLLAHRQLPDSELSTLRGRAAVGMQEDLVRDADDFLLDLLLLFLGSSLLHAVHAAVLGEDGVHNDEFHKSFLVSALAWTTLEIEAEEGFVLEPDRVLGHLVLIVNIPVNEVEHTETLTDTTDPRALSLGFHLLLDPVSEVLVPELADAAGLGTLKVDFECEDKGVAVV